MDLLKLMRKVTVFISLIQWTASDSISHSIVTKCQEQEYSLPDELFKYHDSIPSPLHDLTMELSESQSSLTIRWAINVDSTTRTITGTWISWTLNYIEESYYRCEYQPPFTSEEISLAGLQQLWFSFTVPNVTICPSNNYDVEAYNLPTPDPGTGETEDETGDAYMKSFATELPVEIWNAHIYSVVHDDKIVVTFNSNSTADRHFIDLRKGEGSLKTVEKKGGCKVEECQVELEYTGPCEDLIIQIKPHFEHCEKGSSVRHEVNCTNRPWWMTGVGCVLTLLFVLLCCCIICQILRRIRGSKRYTSVRVLLVYPAVDAVFQRAVMVLAQFLQSHGGVTVIMDMWDRGSLAEQGPLRWLNTQAELADRVLIISPPQRTQTDDLKSNLVPGMTYDTVSASASSLFALTLNLVSSAAHVPHGQDKFWVVNLECDKKSMQTELRGCRTFVLPQDLERLYQQLLGSEIQRPALLTCFRSFWCRNTLEHMDIKTDVPTWAEDVCLDEKPDLLP